MDPTSIIVAIRNEFDALRSGAKEFGVRTTATFNGRICLQIASDLPGLPRWSTWWERITNPSFETYRDQLNAFIEKYTQMNANGKFTPLVRAARYASENIERAAHSSPKGIPGDTACHALTVLLYIVAWTYVASTCASRRLSSAASVLRDMYRAAYRLKERDDLLYEFLRRTASQCVVRVVCGGTSKMLDLLAPMWETILHHRPFSSSPYVDMIKAEIDRFTKDEATSQPDQDGIVPTGKSFDVTAALVKMLSSIESQLAQDAPPAYGDHDPPATKTDA